ncbi:pteridine reductase [Rheinheimera nanhaiensis]|uniref:Glucose 1-dehydrogenase n=1 Tax=Rheinheimera nanhaiensis E407-8 TaxID=562729 RepID=I1DV43_9GAMM|nr:pteridine reductase [Rheinheimera nanhaiensis]GAB57921.1 glucose 1-dehydrogenase [Rheinheimera nanhaiensis E407-8]
MSCTSPVAFITGSAKRLGRAMIETLHQQGYRVIIHCNQSRDEADTLANQLNQQRSQSAVVLQANLLDEAGWPALFAAVKTSFNRLDVLVNNASGFYPTPLHSATDAQWQDLFGSNVKAPYFLSQALAPELAKQQGVIVNMVDIHAEKPLPQHSIYCMAKAALLMMTKALAQELAPQVRVNAIAPGAILWPPPQSVSLQEQDKAAILAQIPLQQLGTPQDIAQALLFLLQSPYINGHILTVDGGRSISGSAKA